MLQLVTVRHGNEDGEDLLSRFGVEQRLELKADLEDSETVNDIRRYLYDAMSRHIDRISLDGALTQLAKNSRASFLCAKFLRVIARSC